MWFSGMIQNNFCCIRRKWAIKSCTICHYKAVASHGTFMSKKPGEVSRSRGPTWLIYIIVKVGETIFFRHMLRLTLFVSTGLYHGNRSHLIHQIRVGIPTASLEATSRRCMKKVKQVSTHCCRGVPICENRKVSSGRDTPWCWHL